MTGTSVLAIGSIPDVRNHEMIPGLPPAYEPGKLLIKHAEYGWMVAMWHPLKLAFFGCGVNDKACMPQVVVFVEDQVVNALGWVRA